MQEFADRSNFRHLVLDIAWFGLALPATTRFLSVFAVRVNADPLHLALMTSLPAIGLIVAAAYTQYWMRHYSSSVKALTLPALLFRLVFLLPAFTPFFPMQWQPLWLLFSVTLPALPQGVAMVTFTVMMREAIAPNNLTALLSRRTLAMNATLGFGALVFGFWLDLVPFPVNYQVMHVLAFLATLVSWNHCRKIQVLNQLPQPNPAGLSPLRSAGFRGVVWVILLSHIAFFVVFPLVPLHLIEGLGASEGFMAVFAVVELGAGALVALITSRMISRMGKRLVIALSMIGTALGSLMIALTPTLGLSLLAALLLGASWAALGIALFGFFMDHTPEDQMLRYTSVYQQVVGLSIFLGPLLGGLLVQDGVNLAPVLLWGGLLRLVAGLLIALMGLPLGEWLGATVRRQPRRFGV